MMIYILLPLMSRQTIECMCHFEKLEVVNDLSKSKGFAIQDIEQSRFICACMVATDRSSSKWYIPFTHWLVQPASFENWFKHPPGDFKAQNERIVEIINFIVSIANKIMCEVTVIQYMLQ